MYHQRIWKESGEVTVTKIIEIELSGININIETEKGREYKYIFESKEKALSTFTHILSVSREQNILHSDIMRYALEYDMT